MKTILMALCLIFSSSIFSKQIELKISSLYTSGEEITKSNETKVIANIGQEFTVPASNGNPFQMKLRVTESLDAIKLNGNISVLINGKLKTVASPVVTTNYGSEAMITTENDDGAFFEMKVTPMERILN